MKDNLTLIAAATGGFMLSIAISGILRGAPVTSWQAQTNLSSTQVAQLQLKPGNDRSEQQLKKFGNSF